MKINFTVLAGILLLPFTLHAQSNFKPGYVVTLKGDTLKGLIEYKDWLKNPTSVNFKTSANAGMQLYSAGQIQGFGVNAIDYYLSYTGPVTTAPVKLSDLSTAIDTGKVNSTIFLRTVSAGSKVAMYAYTDEVKEHFFVAEGNANPVELTRYLYLNRNDSKVIERNIFLTQLLNLAGKYQPANTKLANLIPRTNYELKEIAEIVSAINGPNDTQRIAVAKHEDVVFYLGAAANFNMISFSGSNNGLNGDMFSAGVKTQTVGFGINAGFDYYFNKNAGNLIFRTEASVFLNKIDGSYNHPFIDYTRSFIIKERLDANQLLISLNPQLLYNVVNNSKVKFYIAGGAQISKANYNNQNYKVDIYENNALNNSGSQQLYYKGILFNATAKVGVVLTGVTEIYVGYNPGNNLFNEGNRSANLSTFRLGLNYRFSKK